MPINPAIAALLKKSESIELDGESFEIERPGFSNEDLKRISTLELKTPDDVASLTDFILMLRRATPKSQSKKRWLEAVYKLEVLLNENVEKFFAAGGARLYLERQFEVT